MTQYKYTAYSTIIYFHHWLIHNYTMYKMIGATQETQLKVRKSAIDTGLPTLLDAKIILIFVLY